ncbi:MAG TPA: UvrD-helicase domain-containing protein [Candidatus Binataceae bacterium]|nr:UvrD-helicase domain-containing protein [Candidatus Binataceae bacterium]
MGQHVSSACARILRAEARAVGFEQNFSILDEGDSLGLLRDVIEEAALTDSPTPEIARARIEQAKNEAISPAELAAKAESGRDNAIAHIYRLYRERLRAINAMDFSDLQLLTYELFRDHPEILEKYQRRATHLMVDEYQDTNRVQYLLVKALSARSGNICVVGDEDQSIYKWRGADIRNILDFERDKVRLVALGHAGEVGDRLAGAVFSPQILNFALGIVADDAAGRGQDSFG